MLSSRLQFLGLLTLALSWLGFDHYRPWVNFHSEALALIAVGLLAASCLVRWKGLVFPRLGFWIALTAIVPWIQFASGISLFAGDALVTSLYLCAFLAAVIVGHAAATSKNENGVVLLCGLMHAMWIGAMLSAAIGLMQWLNVAEPLGMYVAQTEVGDRAMGNLAQPNQLATLLLMGMGALLYVYERKTIGNFTFGLGVGFLSVVLVMSESRAGILSGITVAAFLIWKSRHGSRLTMHAIAVWILVLLGATAVLPMASNALMLGSGRGIEFTHSNGRWLIWQQVMHGVMQSPWTGYGWNQTPTAHAAGAIAHPGSLTYTNAHNVVVDMLAWNGLPLGILLSAACGYWLLSRSWHAKRTETVCALASLFPLVIHSLLEYPFAYAYFLVAGGLMIGVVESQMAKVEPIYICRQAAWVLLGGWAIVGGYLCYEYLRIEEDFRVVRFENLRLGRTPDDYEIPDVWMISHLAAMLKAARVTPTPDMSPAQIEELRKVARRFAFGALAVRYATALGLNGDPVGASQELQIIRGMYGEYFYKAAKQELRLLEKEKYPQLGAVAMP